MRKGGGKPPLFLFYTRPMMLPVPGVSDARSLRVGTSSVALSAAGLSDVRAVARRLAHWVAYRVAYWAAPGALACVLAVWTHPAAAQVYRCETESGVPLYQNAPGPRCKPLDLPVITTIPAPRAPTPAPAPAPRPAASGGSGSASGAPAASPGSGNFPRVEAPVQRSRDMDRRRILEDELRKEEARVLELRAEYGNGEPMRRPDERDYQKYLDRVQRLKDAIARSDSAIGSLRREIAALRD